MTNELLFFLVMILDLALCIFFYRLGKDWLKIFIILNLIMVQFSAVKNVEIFGFIANASAVFYASIFIATDILTEHFGKKEGYLSVMKGFASVIFIILFGNLIVYFVPLEASAATEAFNTLMTSAPRIVIASLSAYLIAQNFDVWLFHKIHEHTKGKHLWLRNNGSTLVSQFLDSVIFFGIGFYGVVPNIWSLILFGYVAKLIVAVLDTPFIYLSYMIKKK